jgi:uncharacterized protein
MKLSQYCKKYKGSRKPILFNLLTREEITVGNELFRVLRDRDFGKLSDSLTEDLTDSLVLVPDNFDREINLQMLWDNETGASDRLDVTYALTYKCNMKCSYCVQSAVKDENECKETEFLKWLSDLLEIRKPKYFHLTFFGGEPMLKRRSINTIACSTYELCKKEGIEFEFGITTNGTLINPYDIKLWKTYGLKCLDVTIDGTMENHDRKRIYKNGSGTFDDIIDNLKKIKGIVQINIISNLAPESLSYNEFLVFLSGLKSEINFNSIRFKPYFEDVAGGCFFRECHIETMENVLNEAERLSLPVERNYILGPCGYFDNNTFAVSPGGDIYPCSPFFGNREFILGTIKGLNKLEKRHSIKDNLSSECLFCSFCPVCFGGCRYVSLKVAGNVSTPTCEKKFFQNSLRDI